MAVTVLCLVTVGILRQFIMEVTLAARDHILDLSRPAPEPAPPATTNYIMPDLTQSTPESTEPSTPEPTHESPPTHTGPRPRPTHEWPGAAPFWQPKPHDHEGDWHSEGGPAPPKPENTLIAPAVQDDDFSLLDFLRKAEE